MKFSHEVSQAGVSQSVEAVELDHSLIRAGARYAAHQAEVIDVGSLGGQAVKCRPKESAYVPLLDQGIDAGDAGGGCLCGVVA